MPGVHFINLRLLLLLLLLILIIIVFLIDFKSDIYLDSLSANRAMSFIPHTCEWAFRGTRQNIETHFSSL